jgi:hypothetical protein
LFVPVVFTGTLIAACEASVVGIIKQADETVKGFNLYFDDNRKRVPPGWAPDGRLFRTARDGYYLIVINLKKN